LHAFILLQILPKVKSFAYTNFVKIVLTGGGTGGHIYPNIALLPELRTHFKDIYYIGAASSREEAIAREHGIEFFAVDCVKFDRSRPFSSIKIPFILSRGKKQAVKIMQEIKPDAVFAKGGFVSLPACLAAKKLRIPYVIHESDTSLGLANKVLKKHATKLLVANPLGIKGEVVVGNPIRPEIFEYTEKNQNSVQDKRQKELLIMGGSLGARAINEAVWDALPRLSERYKITHLTGCDCDLAAKNYNPLRYSENIGELYAKADLVISRAGAGAVEELLALNKRVLFVPLANQASRGDQIKNAKLATDKGYAHMLSEQNLCADTLLIELEKLEHATIKQRAYDRNTSKNIVAEILSVIKITA
jgi:UDP-N-acetylglucosamine--N-acetylmuramyl-(pentapeptide) pyrophosphoryl-undecaprenol N-acetylglucosamine transferase